jgi:hypothetical protein
MSLSQQLSPSVIPGLINDYQPARTKYFPTFGGSTEGKLTMASCFAFAHHIKCRCKKMNVPI